VVDKGRVKMYKSIIFVMILLLGSCTINIPSNQPQKQVEKKVPAQIEMKQTEQVTHKSWPQEKKEYWYARYFYTMANHPTIQQMLQPHEVFEIVKCTIKKYEEDHDYAWFLDNLGEVRILTPVNNKYVYDTTTLCANITKAKKKKPVDVRETI
jgi:hypothetical protein